MTQEEIVNYFSQTMQAHAEPRNYDWLIFGVAAASVFASLVVAYYAFQLNKKQIAIAKKQSEISEEQTAIAKKQSEIMEQQNRIALFEKRDELIVMMEQLTVNIKSTAFSFYLLSERSEEYKIAKIFMNMGFMPSESNEVKLAFIVRRVEALKYFFVLDNDDSTHIRGLRNGLASFAINIIDESVNNCPLKLTHTDEMDFIKKSIKRENDIFSQDATLEDKVRFLTKLVEQYPLSEKLKTQLYTITPTKD